MENNKKPLFFDDYKYLDPLLDIGFRHDEAKIYEFLLKNHEQKASEIAKNTGISRVLTYRALENLENKGVIEKYEEQGSVATFTAKHPSELSVILEKQKRQTLKAEAELSQFLGAMSSDFNLATGKPNVQFYEGDEGIDKITEHSLRSKTEILQFIDNDSIVPFLHKENQKYVSQRKEMGIVKKMIVPDDEYSKKAISEKTDNYTKIKILPGLKDFNTTLMMYDNTISYTTAKEGKKMSVIIEDEDIYHLHKTIFESLWNKN